MKINQHLYLLLSLLLSMKLSAASLELDENKESIAIGQVEFSVENRLAIHNVIYAYAFYIDYYDYENWFALYDEDAKFYIKNAGKPPFEVRNFRSVAQTRFEKFKSDGIRRRHMMSNIIIDEQSNSNAHGVIMATLISLQNGKTELITTIRYEGWFKKVDGVWKISKWVDGLENFVIPQDS